MKETTYLSRIGFSELNCFGVVGIVVVFWSDDGCRCRNIGIVGKGECKVDSAFKARCDLIADENLDG